MNLKKYKSELHRKTHGRALLRITERIAQSSPALVMSVHKRCRDQSGMNVAGEEGTKIA